jgi:CRISPR-associated protein Csb2
MWYLTIGVHFHEGRYHARLEGGTDWPPSPARLFQALVSGAARSEMLAESDKSALEWLEALDPPVIAAPPRRAGQAYRAFVPNNDLDSVGGDPKRVGEIRASKLTRPILFEVETPLLYLWTFEANPEAQANVQRVCAIAEWLYQLGRGIDMAWAWGEVISTKEVETRLAMHGGLVCRPSKGAGGMNLAVPIKGSLTSLIKRHNETRTRFQTIYDFKPNKKDPERKVAAGQIFSQPRKPRFGQVAYSSPSKQSVFDLTGPNSPWRLDRIVELTECVRDGVVARLKEVWPAKAACIERVLIGRNAAQADKAARVRIIPLPSIGHHYADHAIRRVLIDIPANCPLQADDLEWAFSALAIRVSDQGEVLTELLPAVDDSMLARYGVESATAACRWRTVTPAALPHSATRRRIEPSRLRDPAEQKRATERAEEHNRAASAVVQALRHAGIAATATEIRVQREPFTGKGKRVEAFALGTRFTKERLWHVEITFAEPVPGPLILGDGRYLGLGLMEPVRDSWRELIVFELAENTRVSVDDRLPFLQGVRRALMALARRGDDTVPRLFSGHEIDGTPARSGGHEHVFLAAADLDSDGHIDRVIVAAPWLADRSVRPRRGDPAVFDRVVSSLKVVRAGRLGVITLNPNANGVDEFGLAGPAQAWRTHTCYRTTRPMRLGDDPLGVLRRDLAAECQRRGLPQPEAEVLDHVGAANGSIAANLLLHFAVGVVGPLLLGRDSHQGGGLFLAER